MLERSHCIAQINFCSWTPVVGQSMYVRPWGMDGLNRILCALIRRPNHSASVLNNRHFEGFSLMRYSMQKAKKRSRRSSSAVKVSAWSKQSSTQRRIMSRSSGGSVFMNQD